jgi:hypothetical protein
MRAATRVNPEQASKVKVWTPTRFSDGEGRGAAGKQPTRAPVAVHRGDWERHARKGTWVTWEAR